MAPPPPPTFRRDAQFLSKQLHHITTVSSHTGSPSCLTGLRKMDLPTCLLLGRAAINNPAKFLLKFNSHRLRYWIVFAESREMSASVGLYTHHKTSFYRDS